MPCPDRTATSRPLASALALLVGLASAVSAVAQTAPPLDRYGGGELYGAPAAAPSTPPSLRPRAQAPTPLAGMRTLSWAGKAQPAAAPVAFTPTLRAPYPLQAAGGAAYQRPAPRPPRLAAAAPPPRAAYPEPTPRAMPASARATDGWVPFDAAAYSAPTPRAPPQAVPQVAPQAIGARWTPPPTPATIYEAPGRPARAAPPRPAPAPFRPAAQPMPQPTVAAVVAPAKEAALPRAAWGSMPPPRGYRLAQADTAPLPAPLAAAPYQGSGVRHYSVHRDFGMRPDATPIPPQFFTATADLSAEANGPTPAGPDPLARRTSSGLTAAQARATVATTVDASQ